MEPGAGRAMGDKATEGKPQSLKGLILAGDKKLLEVLNIGMTCSLWQSLGRG